MFEKTSTVVKGEVLIKIPDVEEWTLTQLRNNCKRHRIKGYTKMSREELIIEVNKILDNMKKD